MLIDLLALETERYTEAFTSGSSPHSDQHRASIDALVAEILIRKQRTELPDANRNDLSMKDNFPCC